MLKLLVEERNAVPLTQTQLSEVLPFPQPVISKIERGERRLDVIELRMFCTAIGMTLPDFVRKLEERLERLPAQEDASA
ncbi:helix-turn-helix transcriptional regulator [Salinarimonas sp.]|uniref:helix-turn-helix domain-containing protein n=1 Tax=Salinarimonas sp. TaxID=2766526 RepID=UPI0032D9915D